MLQRICSFAMRKTMGTITHISTCNQVVALTFDDGPHPESTPRLLDILRTYDAKATFFMVGKSARRYPEIVKRVDAEGHAIGNHSWDHASFPLINARSRREQLSACQNALAPYGCRLFRPPHSHQSLASRLDTLLLGYKVVTCNVVAEDWLDHDADRLVENVVNKLVPGSIILFHDWLYTLRDKRFINRQPMLKAVDMLLQQLSSKFSFVTVPELLKQGRARRRNWYYHKNQNWINKLIGEMD